MRITGTDYTPPTEEHLIEKALDQIMEEQAEIKKSFRESGVFALQYCALATFY